MGWYSETWTIGVTTDAHGGEKQVRHEELVEELRKELAVVCERYKEIATFHNELE